MNFVQGRLPDKWFSLYKRAEYQARALQDYQKKFAGKFLVVKSRQDLKKLVELKKTDPKVIGGFLGIEGAHCLEGNLDNVQNLYYEGVRMMAPTHFSIMNWEDLLMVLLGKGLPISAGR